MKKAITFTIGILALLCLYSVILGSMRAALMQEISESGMKLISDTTGTSDFDAKLYELAYSSPVAPEKTGLWLEAVLARKFETFSTQGKSMTPEFAGKLSGWPLNRAVEIDLSNSPATDEVIARLGRLPATVWINLSGTKVTGKGIVSLLDRAPQLSRLELKETDLSWSAELVDAILRHPSVHRVEVDENALDAAVLAQLKTGLRSR